ncbi:MAG: DUF1552 domain-containing protein [Myxococcota bacterium]
MKSLRRAFLGAGSLAAMSPILRPIAERLGVPGGPVRAQPARRPKVMFYVFKEAMHTDKGARSGGLYNDRDLPDAPTSFTTANMGNWLSGFDEVLDKLTVLERFSQTSVTDLHGNKEGVVTCMPQAGDGPGGPSIDSVIGDHLGSDAIRSSVALGVNAREIHTSETASEFFATGRGQFRFTEGSATQAFSAYLGDVASGGDTPTVPSFPREERLYSYLQEDLGRLKAMIPASERTQLDQYVDGLVKLEQRMGQLGSVAGCAAVLPGVTGMDTREERSAVAASNYMANYGAQMENAFQILACGISPVIAFDPQSGPYDFLGVYGRFNDFWHNANRYEGDTDTVLALQQIQRWHAENLRDFYQRLQMVPGSGGGTLADETLIVAFSRAGGEHHNGYHSHPVLILGDLGGAINAGRYVSYGEEEYSMNDFWVTLANLVGLPLTEFGDYSKKDKKGKGTPRNGVLPNLLV